MRADGEREEDTHIVKQSEEEEDEEGEEDEEEASIGSSPAASP